MREAFSRNAAQHGPVRQWVEERMLEVEQQVAKLPPDQPTVLLHYRCAAGANDHQDMDGIAGQLVHSLISGRAGLYDPIPPPTHRRYGVLVLYAGTQQEIPGALVHLRPFAKGFPHNPKLAHLYLLLALYQKRDKLRLRGVVGNTSGTLDLAALLGHCVLDIHNFQSQSLARVLNYQTYRLLMQFPWIAVVDRATLQMRQQVLDWLALQTDMRRLSVNNDLDATADVRVLRSPATAPFSAVGGLGEQGFRMVATEYIKAANGSAGWRALPPQAVGEILAAAHSTMRQLHFVNQDTILRLDGLNLNGPAQGPSPLVSLQQQQQQVVTCSSSGPSLPFAQYQLIDARVLPVDTLTPRLTALHLRAHDCGGDGACLYKSFVHQLNRRNINLTWQEVKARALQWLKARNAAAIQVFRAAVVHNLPTAAAQAFPLIPTPDQWCAAVDSAYGGEQAWGDESILRALASEFQVNVRIMSSAGANRDVLIKSDHQPPLDTFTIVHIAELHYQSTAVLPHAP